MYQNLTKLVNKEILKREYGWIGKYLYWNKNKKGRAPIATWTRTVMKECVFKVRTDVKPFEVT